MSKLNVNRNITYTISGLDSCDMELLWNALQEKEDVVFSQVDRKCELTEMIREMYQNEAQ